MEGYPRHRRIGKSFGVGVVGLGEGKGLVKGLYGHPDLHVVAVCDVDEDRLRAVQKQFSVPYAYRDLEAMVARDDIDIVAIYTPDHLHRAHIQIALEAGKHVICTKPLVNTLEEALEVVRLVQRYPEQRLMVGQSSRFFGPMQLQREAFEKGLLGKLYFADAHYVHDMRWFYGNREWALKGGLDLIFGGCSHPVDLIRWYMGDVDEVEAYGDRSPLAAREGFLGQDIFVVNLKFTSGRIGRVMGLYGLHQPHQSRAWIELTLCGDRGTFIAKYPQLEVTTKFEDQPERVEHHFEDIYHYFQFEGINHHAGEFTNYTEYFAMCLRDGRVPQPDALDGAKTIATLEAIRQSIGTGRPQKVAAVELAP